MSFVDGSRFGVFCINGGGRRSVRRAVQLHQQTALKIPHEERSSQSKIHQVPERYLNYMDLILNETIHNNF